MTDIHGAIACLGWGSLVWDPRDLPVRGPWHSDGPPLPLEFGRESGAKATGERGDRITLVICADSPRVRSCWTLLDVPDLESARQRLAGREGMKGQKSVGFWDRAANGGSGHEITTIAAWAVAHDLSAVVWTDLSCKFDGDAVKPTIEQVLAFLGGLDDEKKALSEGYIRQAPAQIDTPYRRLLAERLGWHCRAKF